MLRRSPIKGGMPILPVVRTATIGDIYAYKQHWRHCVLLFRVKQICSKAYVSDGKI